MQSLNQKTLLSPVSFKGIGLHSGLVSNVRLIPAEANSGVIFKRVDVEKNNLIRANFKNVSSSKLCTTLSNSEGVSVSTVEHLLASFYIAGIDNVIVEINNLEVPIMDGSSKDFIALIKQTGLKELEAKRKFLKILKKVEFKENEKTISIEPSDNTFEVNFQLGYKNKVIGNQKNSINFQTDNLEDIYTSRTFCLFEDIEKIKEIGLAKGGSLDNAVVVKDNEILNEGGLRNKKEFVNHKILDLAGDFLLSGYRIIGIVKCNQGGHYLSNTFLKEIFNDSSNFAPIDLNNVQIVEKNFKSPINKLAVNA
jgi:UDP-3-O-[3-hydroxymyristoyl] N-acetylglucosamine deacetylase